MRFEIQAKSVQQFLPHIFLASACDYTQLQGIYLDMVSVSCSTSGLTTRYPVNQNASENYMLGSSKGMFT